MRGSLRMVGCQRFSLVVMTMFHRRLLEPSNRVKCSGFCKLERKGLERRDNMCCEK